MSWLAPPIPTGSAKPRCVATTTAGGKVFEGRQQGNHSKVGSRGVAPDPTRRLCLLDLRQGQWPLDPLVALMRGVADHDPSRSVSATPLINAINRFQRASPFGGVPRGKAPWRVRGQSPRASRPRAIALRPAPEPFDTRHAPA